MISCTNFFKFRPHLPFRFITNFYTGKEVPSGKIGLYVSSIKVNMPDVDTSTAATYYGDGYRTIPLVDPSTKTIDVTFEETDDMQVLRFLDGIIEQQRFGLPYVVQIGITEFEERMNAPVRAMLYSCVLVSYEEPSFSRTGGVSLVTLSATFAVMSEKPWENDAQLAKVGKQAADTGYNDGAMDKLTTAADNSQPSAGNFDAVAEWNKQFNEDLKAGREREAKEKDQKDEEAKKKEAGYDSSGNGGKYAPPGKQMQATGGVGKAGITHAALTAAATDEFTGKNGAGRTEGRADMVYFNSLDGGKQKLNFGMGNTQSYLEGLGLKDKQFTIEATINGEKVTLTGTMEQLTEKVKAYGHANSSATAWKMDAKTEKMVTAASMGNIANKIEKAYDPEILAAMDRNTLGGLAHIEYGSGGSSKVLGAYMNANKEAVIAELKKNNGQLSDEFVNKMMNDKSVKKVLYKEWTVKEGKNAGQRMAVDRRGRLTGKSGHSMRKLN